MELSNVFLLTINNVDYLLPPDVRTRFCIMLRCLKSDDITNINSVSFKIEYNTEWIEVIRTSDTYTINMYDGATDTFTLADVNRVLSCCKQNKRKSCC